MFFFVLVTKDSTKADLCKLNICTKRRLNVVTASSVNKGFAIVQTEKGDEA